MSPSDKSWPQNWLRRCRWFEIRDLKRSILQTVSNLVTSLLALVMIRTTTPSSSSISLMAHIISHRVRAMIDSKDDTMLDCFVTVTLFSNMLDGLDILIS